MVASWFSRSGPETKLAWRMRRSAAIAFAALALAYAGFALSWPMRDEFIQTMRFSPPPSARHAWYTSADEASDPLSSDLVLHAGFEMRPAELTELLSDVSLNQNGGEPIPCAGAAPRRTCEWHWGGLQHNLRGVLRTQPAGNPDWLAVDVQIREFDDF